MSTFRKKVFPSRLPQNFHGQPRTVKNLRDSYYQKISSNHSNYDSQNPQLKNNKIVQWQIKRLNNDIQQQRKQYLVHVGQDTPHWFQTTTNYYRREEAPTRPKNVFQQNRPFDIIGKRRMSLTQRLAQSQFNTNYSAKRQSMLQSHQSWNVTDKIGSDQYLRTGNIHYFKSDITPKIGSVEHRDFQIKKPQMKIGKNEFINTYSPK